MTHNSVLVHCEITESTLAPLSLELLGVGSRLAQDLKQELIAVLIGNNITPLAQEAIAYGANKVYAVDNQQFKDYLPDLYLAAMDKVFKETSPAIMLFGQTQIGRDLTPRMAFRLNTAAILDCVALAIDPTSKRMIMTKPVYGGNAQAIQICETNPQIATLRSKSSSPAAKDSNRKGDVIIVTPDITPSSASVKILGRNIETETGVKLEDARIIVSGGRGIGSADGFKQLEQLAKLLKGALGASRPPCDNKWISDSLQIGLTGKIVSPDLYFAVAISGSSQHLSGCSGAKIIIAINKDKEANIFKIANYGVIADWKKVIPALTENIEKLVK
jgi:electron transfer flavoprotein alpha subunit